MYVYTHTCTHTCTHTHTHFWEGSKLFAFLGDGSSSPYWFVRILSVFWYKSFVKLLLCKYCLLVSRQYCYFLNGVFWVFLCWYVISTYKHGFCYKVFTGDKFSLPYFFFFIISALSIPRSWKYPIFSRKFIVLCFCVKLIFNYCIKKEVQVHFIFYMVVHSF